ncbi:MAG: adenosylmethionine decarboxylase [Burkholderiales bacterium]|nr:adenosylmethionine decarboxylase [Burkholderiales bacterium]
MQGLHLTADLSECASGIPALTDPGALRGACLAAVAASGLQVVGESFHAFAAPGGVTGVVLLAESHLAVHTWPEHGAVTLDVFVCSRGQGNAARAEAVLAALEACFAPGRVRRQRIERGWD